MMRPYSDPKIKHVGKNAHRINHSAAERVFAEQWAKQQKSSHTLEWLFCASDDQQGQDRDLTQAEATTAATLMQWLGSPVGLNWLRETLAKVGLEVGA